MSELKEQTIRELFMNLMQHLKCIEIRLEYAKAITSQKQKYAINLALTKARGAINNICDLLGSSDQVLQVKKELENVNLVYVMLLTEQLCKVASNDMEEVAEIIDKYLIDKYGSESK